MKKYMSGIARRIRSTASFPLALSFIDANLALISRSHTPGELEALQTCLLHTDDCMAGTRLLIQAYFVLVLVVFVAWAIWHETIPRGRPGPTEARLAEVRRRLTARLPRPTCSANTNTFFVESEPIATQYDVEFIIVDFPFDDLVAKVQRVWEPRLAALSQECGVRFATSVRRKRPAEKNVFRDPPERGTGCFRFVLETAEPPSAHAVDGGCDGGVIASTAVGDVLEIAYDILRSALGPDLAARSARDNALRALDALAMLRDVANLTRPYDASLAVSALERASRADTDAEVAAFASQAAQIAMAALRDPALALPQHVPAEHLAAIYAPLVLPLVAPLLLGLRAEIRRYRQLRAKVRARAANARHSSSIAASSTSSDATPLAVENCTS